MKKLHLTLVSILYILSVGCASLNEGDRWHSYHLTKAAPISPDGMFQLVEVTPIGDAKVIFLLEGTVKTVRAFASAREIADSVMPMRHIKSDPKAQIADFEWMFDPTPPGIPK